MISLANIKKTMNKTKNMLKFKTEEVKNTNNDLIIVPYKKTKYETMIKLK